MFEGYSRNKYISTGVIQWMLNNPWPEMVWHLYDYFFQPSGSFFGTQKACEPLHVMFAYNDNSVWVVNSGYNASQSSLIVSAAVMDFSGRALMPPQQAVLQAVPADGVVRAFALSLDQHTVALPPAYLLRLLLLSPENTVLSINDYWLSTRADVLDWNNSTFYTTFCTQYADFTSLSSLQPVQLKSTIISSSDGVTQVTISNPNGRLPSWCMFSCWFLLRPARRLSICCRPMGDNYVTLLPFEQRTLMARR